MIWFHLYSPQWRSYCARLNALTYKPSERENIGMLKIRIEGQTTQGCVTMETIRPIDSIWKIQTMPYLSKEPNPNLVDQSFLQLTYSERSRDPYKERGWKAALHFPKDHLYSRLSSGHWPEAGEKKIGLVRVSLSRVHVPVINPLLFYENCIFRGQPPRPYYESFVR